MIRSTFYGFGIAQSGMFAAQRALDLTGNNMSNVNTTGYTRQRLDLYSIPSASYADRYASGSKSAIGGGVNVAGVGQLRDPFLDARFRREASMIGELEANLSSLSDIATTFDGVQKKALQDALQNFSTQLQVYTDRTSEVEIEGTVRAAAESVLRLFNQYSNQLATVRQDQKTLLDDVTIPKINSILESISILNKNIKTSEIYGNPALELKDQRNMLIDELSTYMRIDVSYEPDEKFPSIDNLRITFLAEPPEPGDPTLTPAQRTLVFADTHTTISSSTDAVTGDVQIHSSVAGAGIDLKFTTGALKGVLDMLNSQGEFDNPPNTVRGIGYYQKILDQVVNDFATQFNEANKALDDPGPPPTYLARNLFEAKDGSGVITAGNIAIAQDWVNGTYGLTETKMPPPTGGTTDVSGGRENILYMISLLDKKFEFTTEGIGANTTPPATARALYKGSFHEMFSNIGVTAALDVNSKNTALDSYVSVISGIEDLRNSLSSVSMDEEGVNLLRFQKSYTAAARVMTTLDEALDVLINRMGIVGR